MLKRLAFLLLLSSCLCMGSFGQAFVSEIGYISRQITVDEIGYYSGEVVSSKTSAVTGYILDLGIVGPLEDIWLEMGLTLTLLDKEKIPDQAEGSSIFLDRLYIGAGFKIEPENAPLNFFAFARAYPVSLLYNTLTGIPFIVGMLSVRGGIEVLLSERFSVKAFIELPFGYCADPEYTDYEVSMKGYNLKITFVVPWINW
jgi:hypothetical protein